MTHKLVSDMPRRMGRKKQWVEDMQARFPEGTFERISALLVGNEDRTDFVRVAVAREIRRRAKLHQTNDATEAPDNSDA